MEPTTVNRSAELLSRHQAEQLVSQLITDQSASMLATARRYSLCADDAHDAWQRALEILLRRASSLDPQTAAGWLRTVVKHEALAVRADRSRHTSGDEFDPDLVGSGLNTAESRERYERIASAAEALQRLKPAEAEAFMLLASGMSYREIADAKGWTYTKVNRLVTEGRKAFRLRVAGIESGEECDRWRASLTRIADGEATTAERTEVAPHLKHCLGCRALLRSDREAAASMALLGPAFVIPAEAHTDTASRTWGQLGRWLSDLPLLLGLRLQGAADAVAASKVAAVAATSVAIAGGGVALQQQHSQPHRTTVQPASVRSASNSGGSINQVEAIQASTTPAESAGRSKPSIPQPEAGSIDSGKRAQASADDEFDPLGRANSSSKGTGPSPKGGAPIAAAQPATQPHSYSASQVPAATDESTGAPAQSSSKTAAKSTSKTVEFGP